MFLNKIFYLQEKLENFDWLDVKIYIRRIFKMKVNATVK